VFRVVPLAAPEAVEQSKILEEISMKKLISLALALVLALSLTACSGDGPADIPPTQDGNTQSTSDASGSDTETPDTPANGKATDSLIQWMISGTFSYDFTMTSEGPDGKIESKGSIAMDGNNMAVTMEMTVDGQPVRSRVIIKDDATYIVDDVNKLVIKSPDGMDVTAGMMTDYSGISLTGSGTGEINGRTLPYEEYTQEGAMVRCYFDNGQVYGIESEYEGYISVMIITNQSRNVPAGAFDLPKGYTQM
jgi:predicted small lipoprotein YifL